MTKDEIIEALEAAGIDHDKRMSVENLAKLLPDYDANAQDPHPTNNLPPTMPIPDEKRVMCVVQRDFWDADGVRHCKGMVIGLTTEEALDGIETGAISRLKD